MRTRAYRPEAPDCLEDRSLLSGAAGPSADPVVLPNARLDLVITQIRLNFQEYSQNRDISALRGGLLDVAVIIPFGRVDGLGVPINRIVNTMQEEVSAKVRFAIPLAADAAIAVTRAFVLARVRAGEVIVR